MPNNVVPFNKPFIAGKELDYITQAVNQGQLSGDGPFTGLCHAWLEERLPCAKAFLTHSCTAALEMTAFLIDLQPGDEVIMPSFTFVSTANAFVLRGAVPVFVDIRPDTLNIDERLLEAAITPRTKAIVVVHYAGAACAMEEIMALAARRGLWVIEDAAQALLSTYQGRSLGTIGHLGCISFHETKNIISGEGGALLVNEPSLIKRAEILREKGTNRSRFFRGEVDKYTWVDVGSSYLPGELTAAFLYAQLEQADPIIAERCRTVERYAAALRPLEQRGVLRLPIVPAACRCNGHMFYVLTRSLEERTLLLASLKQRGVDAVFHYVPLHSSPAGLRYGRARQPLAVTDDLSDRLVRLPMFHGMRDDEIEQVVAGLRAFYDGGAAAVPAANR